MSGRNERPEPTGPPSVRDHLANERTLLAWVRTALTIIGLGFLIDRLSVGSSVSPLAAYAGIGLVLFGGVVALAGAYSYLNARRELATGTFRSQVRLHMAVVGVVVLGALVVALFLALSPVGDQPPGV